MKDVGFTRLGTGAAIDDDGLRALYEYPDATAGCLVRANFVAGIDGAATHAGASGGLGGPGDRRLFGILRELADVIVVGAGTARAENYGGAKMQEDQQRRRRARGQCGVPPIAVITRAGVIASDARILTETEVPPLVLTSADAAGAARRSLGSAADVFDCSGSDPGGVDLPTALRRLADRGLTRVLTEGGPSLLGVMVAQDLLDEMCLTVAPVLTGGPAGRIASGSTEALTRMSLAHVVTDTDDFLYTRYVRAR